MKKRKTKSKLTRVDLDAVLKLQKEHEYLKAEVCKTFSLTKSYEHGNLDAGDFVIMSGNDLIHHIIETVLKMARRIKELEEKLNDGKSSEASPQQGD